MARLCDIVRLGVKCKVRSPYGAVLSWGGRGLNYKDGSTWPTDETTLLNEGWQLVESEPTVADVLKERGYAIWSDNGSMMLICEIGTTRQCTLSLNCPKLTTTAETTRVCDFLDSLRSGK